MGCWISLAIVSVQTVMIAGVGLNMATPVIFMPKGVITPNAIKGCGNSRDVF